MFRFIILLCIVGSIYSLSCPCLFDERYKNNCKTPENCSAGITRDACGCCDVCARGEGESCGGPWFLSGRCGKGLKCDRGNTYVDSIGVCRYEI
uniref:TSA: Tityus bahiensis Tbah01400 mRNA sequence n=1 Tax=Tityus bahiensis TaxID=50343 RepID=A0A0C9RPB1_TITBA